MLVNQLTIRLGFQTFQKEKPLVLSLFNLGYKHVYSFYEYSSNELPLREFYRCVNDEKSLGELNVTFLRDSTAFSHQNNPQEIIASL